MVTDKSIPSLVCVISKERTPSLSCIDNFLELANFRIVSSESSEFSKPILDTEPIISLYLFVPLVSSVRQRPCILKDISVLSASAYMDKWAFSNLQQMRSSIARPILAILKDLISNGCASFLADSSACTISSASTAETLSSRMFRATETSETLV